MDAQPQPYELLILVCTNERPDGKACCAVAREGGASGFELRAWLKDEVKARGYRGRVRVSQSGCLDRCAEGPNIFVFPEGTWYRHVGFDDLPQILERHLSRLAPPLAS